MQIDDLVRAYQSKTDEELLLLAENPTRLTSDAVNVLNGELAKRRIQRVENSVKEISPSIGEPSASVETLPTVSTKEFLADVLRLYHEHFWIFFKLITPAVAIGWAAIALSRHEGREIARHLPRDVLILQHQKEFIEIMSVNFAGFFVSWIAFCVSFAATCSATRQIRTQIVPSIADSISPITVRIGSFLRISSLLFLLMLTAQGLAGVAISAILWALDKFHSPLNMARISIVSWICISGGLLLLSRFALAMPAVILDNHKIRRALFLSDELTEGKWLILGILLAKSLFGGYIAGLVPFWLVAAISHRTPLPSWFEWVLVAASIVAVSIFEPVMFIGFALLYLRMTATPQPASEAYISS